MSSEIASELGHLALAHDRVRMVDPQIFRARFAPDCMRHRCKCLDEDKRLRFDACCQHGCDVSLAEREAILRRAEEVSPVLDAAWRDPARWFDASDPETDCEGTTWLRTSTVTPDESSGCVFLQHDKRGCALHRAALEHAFAPSEIKPMVCRLYPLSWYEGLLCLSDDFHRYSCSEMSGPTVYRLLRPVLAETFGLDVIPLLDHAERSTRRRRLPVVAHP
jgi:Fe-S-cluster containining protein